MTSKDDYMLNLAGEILAATHFEYPGAVIVTDNDGFMLVLCNLSRETAALDEQIISWAPTLETLHQRVIRNSKKSQPFTPPDPK